MNAELDLVVLFADADAERFVTTLVERGIERGCLRPIAWKAIRDPMHDARVADAPAATLAPFLRMSRCRFVVIFDHHGSGHDSRSIDEVEADTLAALARAGVDRERVLVLVFEPELEVTLVSVWDRVLELLARKRDVAKASVPMNAHDPKTSWASALQRYRLKTSAALFGELARELSLAKLKEGEALSRLSDGLVRWFGASFEPATSRR